MKEWFAITWQAETGVRICPPALKKWRMQVHEPSMNPPSSFWGRVAAAIVLAQELVCRDKLSSLRCHEFRNMLVQPSLFSPEETESLARPAETQSLYSMEQSHTAHCAYDEVHLTGDESR